MGCPRAGLQLKACDVDPPPSRDASRGNLRLHIPITGTRTARPTPAS